MGNLDGFPARVVSDVPLLGRSLVAERTVAEATVAVLGVARQLLAQAGSLGHSGHIDLTRLAALHAELLRAHRELAAPLHRLAALNTALTPASVAKAVAEARNRLLGLGPAMGRLADLTAAAQDMFGANGPRTILIALENNAELRGTGGVVSAIAIAHASGGVLKVGPFTDVRSVATAPTKARAVPAPADYLATYGIFKANTTIWKNANDSPDVAASSQVLAELAGVSLGVHPDYVLLVDVPAMAAIIGSTGHPVRLPDGELASGGTLVHDLLVQSYGSAPLSLFAERARRLALERVAGNVVRKVAAHTPSLALLRALAYEVAGRHLCLWSARPAVEAELVAAGVGGAFGHGDVVSVTADNLGDSPGNGNKLDYYARRSLAVNVALGKHKATVIETLSLANDAPNGLGPYVAGPRHPGRLTELVGLTLPANARISGFSINGAGSRGEVRPLVAGTNQLLTEIILNRGARDTLVLAYTVPLTHGGLHLGFVPQPLAVPATLNVRVGTVHGAQLAQPPLAVSGPWTTVRKLVLQLR